MVNSWKDLLLTKLVGRGSDTCEGEGSRRLCTRDRGRVKKLFRHPRLYQAPDLLLFQTVLDLQALRSFAVLGVDECVETGSVQHEIE